MSEIKRERRKKRMRENIYRERKEIFICRRERKKERYIVRQRRQCN